MATVENDIYDIIADKAAVDRAKLHRDAKMTDLEIESLDVVEIIFAIEEKFDIHVPYNANDSAPEFATVGEDRKSTRLNSKSLMRNSSAVHCLKNNNRSNDNKYDIKTET